MISQKEDGKALKLVTLQFKYIFGRRKKDISNKDKQFIRGYFKKLKKEK